MSPALLPLGSRPMYFCTTWNISISPYEPRYHQSKPILAMFHLRSQLVQTECIGERLTGRVKNKRDLSVSQWKPEFKIFTFMAFFWQTFDHQWCRLQQPSFPPFGKHAVSRQFHHPQLHTLRKFCRSSSPPFFDEIIQNLLKISLTSFVKLSKSGTTRRPLNTLSMITMLGLITLQSVVLNL